MLQEEEIICVEKEIWYSKGIPETRSSWLQYNLSLTREAGAVVQGAQHPT